MTTISNSLLSRQRCLGRKIPNVKIQMSNQTQMLQCQSLPLWTLDFDIRLNFGTLAFDILKMDC